MKIAEITPYIHAGYYYHFPKERDPGEKNRTGYCYAFNFIAEGRGSITIAGKKYPLRKGDFFLIPPLQLHSFDSAEEPNLLVVYNLYCDLWNPSPLLGNPLVTHNNKVEPQYLVRIVPCAELDELPSVHSLRHRPLLAEIFVRIYDLYAIGQPAALEIAHLYLLALLKELVMVPRQEPYDPRIVQLVERLERGGELLLAPIGEWAQAVGLAGTQFHTLFKQMMGLSPQAFRTRIRMGKAAAALVESTRSISDIAFSTGYATIHHFSKQFTAYYGVSPSAYRGRHIRKERLE